jgi:hypothetical protein
VLDTVVARLQAASLNAFRCRFTPFSDSELPAINVLPADEEFEYQDSASVEELFHFDVRHVVSTIDAADKAADAQYILAARALLADITLGGTVRTLRLKKKKPEMEQGEKQYMALVVTYETEFSSTRSDPSVASF